MLVFVCTYLVSLLYLLVFLFVCVASLDKMVSWFPLGKRDMFGLGTFLSLQMRWWWWLFLIFWLWPVFSLLEIIEFFVNPCFDPFSVGMVCWKRSSVCCWDLWETPQECHQQWQQTGKEKFWDFLTIFCQSLLCSINSGFCTQSNSEPSVFAKILIFNGFMLKKKQISRTNQWNQWMESIDYILDFSHIVQIWCNVVLSSFNLIWFKYCYISLPPRSIERHENLSGCQREKNCFDFSSFLSSILIMIFFHLWHWVPSKYKEWWFLEHIWNIVTLLRC